MMAMAMAMMMMTWRRDGDGDGVMARWRYMTIYLRYMARYDVVA